MSREKKTAPGVMRRAQAWGIVVVLKTGERLYYYHDDHYCDGRGKPLEGWGRESDAHRFTTENEARRLASSFDVINPVRSYDVVQLPWKPN